MANEQIDPMVLRLVDRKGDVALVLRNASPPTKIRVSSRALISASPFFRAMLNGHYAEGKQLIETGRAEIELEDEDDPEAMVMVLKAIHSRHTPRFEQIPRTLMRVIIILDKFMIPREKFERQLLACVETLQPPTDSDEMTCLVCIVWMLGYPSVFAMLARAIVVAGVKLDFTGLPVPGQVAGMISQTWHQNMNLIC
ncbi:hypothetical protein ASPZODRAFT_139579 [Penicilliopsis zonata CBS 506.65]|uniref:BTB domain-containing protein n=1 Tax=Penicilliopsis zonata CBS 506.65 TaxID=1073090 RepID=A0A1L9ST40_9EURO|nr:hypothetical protein ASPZODRAFT_139579 [Penicilliopsis zonata CBS 506.65]OJJ50267.1 hypothetical protein ASPZODRAFT_139579 [Penicilliopsis zonata CBS 506.65]